MANQVTLTIERRLIEEADEAAREENTSRSGLVRKALRRYISEKHD